MNDTVESHPAETAENVTDHLKDQELPTTIEGCEALIGQYGMELYNLQRCLITETYEKPVPSFEYNLSTSPTEYNYDFVIMLSYIVSAEHADMFIPKNIKIQQIIEALAVSNVTYKKTDEGYVFSLPDNGGEILIFSNENDELCGYDFASLNNTPERPPSIALKNFLTIVQKLNIYQLFFKQNPYFEAEKEVANAAKQPLTPIPVSVIKPDENVELTTNDILIIPDRHGDQEKINRLTEIIESGKVKWLGIEMYPHTLKKQMQDYVHAPNGSVAFEEAKKAIYEHLISSHGWREKFDDGGDISAHPYIKILDVCRKHNVDVYPLDTSDLDYFKISGMGPNLPFFTRNVVWSQQIPPNGPGVIFGGSAHFIESPGLNVQDFIGRRDSSRTFKIMDFPPHL